MSRTFVKVVGLGLVAQAIGFGSQMVIASRYGAGGELDAFIAAGAVPQYVTSVFLNPISVSLVPVLTARFVRNETARATALSRQVLVGCAILCALIAAVGCAFAEGILVLSMPGLPAVHLPLATRLAWLAWLSLIPSGIVTVQLVFCQVQNRFGWMAVAPLAGALANLLLILALSPRLGVLGLGVALGLSTLVQVVTLIRHTGRAVAGGAWLEPESRDLREVVSMAAPLVLSGVIVRITPLVERFLALDTGIGNLSHLGYASRITSAVLMLVSSGWPAMLFSRLSGDVAARGPEAARRSFGIAFRWLWLAIAPAAAVGIALAQPLVSLLLVRGEFSEADASSVASLLRVLLIAMIGMSLGTVSARALYALGANRAVGVVSVIETVAFVVYSHALSEAFGVLGVVAASAIYFNVSVLWQVALIIVKTRARLREAPFARLLHTALAALAAAAAAGLTASVFESSLARTVMGGAAALAVFSFAAFGLASGDGRLLWRLRSPEPLPTE